MERKEPRRFRLPLLTAKEPTVAEGARSLSRWTELHKDLARHPQLRDELRGTPDAVLARYGLTGSTPAEIGALVDAILAKLGGNSDLGR